jgi:hypothetical protein
VLLYFFSLFLDFQSTLILQAAAAAGFMHNKDIKFGS